MTEAQQAQSLTTGEDVRPKRTLASRAAQPNKKREGGHLWSNLCVIAFCVAGLVLTLKDQVRGDQHMFMISFAVAIGISGAEVILNIVLMVVSNRCCNTTDQEGGSCKKCGSAFLSAGCAACFVLLVISLVSSKGVPQTVDCGCVNNYGCANIMAIIACIIYGLRLLAILICLPCLICVGCCACSACCALQGDAGESGQQQQQQQQQQNSSL